jgi:mono/diheme cytochrome c family protein
MDAIPGRVNHTWFQPKKLGTYDARCTQLCGTFHYKMSASVKVVRRSEYDAFLASHNPGSQAVAREAFVGVCSKCHGMNGAGDYGPTLQNRDFELGDITKLLHLGRNRMPAVGNDWNAAQIAALVHYLRQTKGGATLGH